MNKYFLGIDGGGTKTAFCLINENKEIVKVVTSGPSSLDTVGEEGLLHNLREVINKEFNEYEIMSVFAGIGGITNEEEANGLALKLKELKCFKNTLIKFDNDIINAIMSYNGEEEGIAAIIGTGSVAYAVNNGIRHRCGGYCYQEGDPGSSYDLGYKALKHLAKVLDSREKETMLSKAIMNEHNIFDYSSLAKFFIKGRTDIASVAKVVTKVASSKCDKAIEIIEDAVNEIVLMIETVYKKVGFENTTLSIIGSLGNANTYYREYLMKVLKEKLPNIKIVQNKYEAYYAASLKAYNVYFKS